MFVKHKELNCFFIICCVLVSSVYSEIEAPKLLDVTVTKEGGLYVVWESIDDNVSDPILGYKIKIWEVKEKTERMFKLINADQVPGFVKEDRASEDFSKDSIPENKPRMFRADPDSTSLEIGYIKPDALNEIRIQAYKQKEDGAYSEPWRLKVFKEYGHDAVGHRHKDECILTVTTQTRAMGGPLPHIYNSHL
ncbi:uncharacterized protein LOC124536303 [Vanessa cardui]|uniref:uncharacterized protein LOC124536303 n=1 Tax=Vanessa cardui TaxID=171605 RepID=UPI001F1437B9|nr:uncharacterized protein LOC124536303 [Vanessa cardui]XP_046968777.1 uncharacterized protein LOC124536303 [Vanessa cardui]